MEHAVPVDSKEVVGLLGEFYAVDRRCPTGPPGASCDDEFRASMRHRWLAERIRVWVMAARARTFQESGLVKAIENLIESAMLAGLERMAVQMDATQLTMLLDGIDVGRVRRPQH